MSTPIVNQWTGCYAEGWQGLIVPDAFAHPAKFARGLIQRIYAHAHEEGWLVPGAVVLDPFGGVALGALDACLRGYHWVGCELEPRFVALAEANLALWQRRYGLLPGYGTAVCVEGDSRQLEAVLQAATWVLTSPPYAGAGRLLATSNGIDWSKTQGTGQRLTPGRTMYPYGTTPGNLGNLPSGPPPACVVTSPPYSGNEKADYRLSADGKTRARDEFRGYRQGHGCFRGSETYGQTEGQLGAMPQGVVQAVVSSPPFGQSLNNGHTGSCYTTPQPLRGGPWRRGASYGQDYGTAPGQLGTTAGDMFWSAACTILEQCYALLPVGGHACFVVKSYVKGGQLVDFPGQWAALCQQGGFTWLHRHQALLTTAHGTELGLFGGETVRQTKRVSFFRHLHERQRPDLAIDCEEVLCFVKPGGD